MKIIASLSDTIECLLDSASDNINYAYQIKDEHPSVATAYYNLSLDQMKHIGAMHEQVSKLIEDYRKTNGDPSERMMGRYEYLHEKHIKKANEIKILQGLFK